MAANSPIAELSESIPLADRTLASIDAKLEQRLSEIERKIVANLFNVGLHCYDTDFGGRAWTGAIKHALIELGLREGYLPFPNKFERTRKHKWTHGGQWLFDLIWLDAKDPESSAGFDWRRTTALKLACESEWSTDEYQVLEDFLKLTFSSADLRLFIYTNRDIRTEGGSGTHPVKLFRQVCPGGRGFRYLSIGFPRNKTGQFRIDAWLT